MPEKVDMIGCFGWILTTNVNIKEFSACPSLSLLLSKALYALPLSLSNYSSCECVCLDPSPHSILSIFEHLEAKSCVIHPHAQEQFECLVDPAGGPIPGTELSTQKTWATIIIKKCLMNEGPIEFLGARDTSLLEKLIISWNYFYLAIRLQKCATKWKLYCSFLLPIGRKSTIINRIIKIE